MLRIFSRVMFVAAILAAVGCGSTVVVAPPAVDGGVVCRFPDGRECRQGQSCSSPDGCNTCACGADGTLACTLRACVDGGPPDVPTPRMVCRSTADCAIGEQCLIAEGCATPSYCDRGTRVCSGDVAPFCGCAGTTFYASSTCPTEPYARRGACEDVDGGRAPCRFSSGRLCPFGQRCPADDGCNSCVCTPLGFSCTEIACFDAGPPADGGGVACAAMDARGEGDCDGYFGVAWDGTACVSLTGCRCVGADCGRVFRDRAACVAACGG